MIPFRFFPGAVALCALSGCASGSPDPDAFSEPEVSRLNQIAPPGAEPGTCWGKNVTPAIIETVTHQVLMQPAQVLADGTVTQQAAYRTETRQDIVRERRETWFLTPCANIMTPEFIASVQRGLAARDLYKGEISGKMDPGTRAAVRRYQKPQGLDSGTLSLAGARKLGLIEITIEETG